MLSKPERVLTTETSSRTIKTEPYSTCEGAQTLTQEHMQLVAVDNVDSFIQNKNNGITSIQYFS
jgi:hypothetical protein